MVTFRAEAACGSRRRRLVQREQGTREAKRFGDSLPATYLFSSSFSFLCGDLLSGQSLLFLLRGRNLRLASLRSWLLIRLGLLPVCAFPRAPFASPPGLCAPCLWRLSPVLAAEPALFPSPLVLCKANQRVMTNWHQLHERCNLPGRCQVPGC